MQNIIDFEKLDPMFKQIVEAIVKAVGTDIRDFLSENSDETHNAIRLIRGDKINSNLRNYVVSDTVELHSFTRHAWEGRILIDREHKVTISVLTKQTFEGIMRKERKSPHYLMSIAHIENSDVSAESEQLSLFSPEGGFTDDDYCKDFETIMGDEVGSEDGYHQLVVVYETEKSVVTSISVRLVDKNLLTSKEYPLEKFLKPDLNDLTFEPEEIVDKSENDVRHLIGIKVQKEEEKKTPKQEILITLKEEKGENRA